MMNVDSVSLLAGRPGGGREVQSSRASAPRKTPPETLFTNGGRNLNDKTRANVYKAFIGEAKAYFRLLAYADKADAEDLPQIALLFRAIAEAERVHATRQLGLVKDVIVKDTDTNLEKSFQREKSVSENTYPEFIKDAEDEGEQAAALAFSHARDAESYHAKLYERAIMNVIKAVVKAYQVCQVCGYVTDKKAPEKCPICGAPREQFRAVEK
jgi:rubrerythrin